jgi:hypothetical protein
MLRRQPNGVIFSDERQAAIGGQRDVASCLGAQLDGDGLYGLTDAAEQLRLALLAGMASHQRSIRNPSSVGFR